MKRLFWDCRFATVSWDKHRDFVIGRVLSCGGLDDLRWLRGRVGDDELRRWIMRRRGRGLSGPQLRYWELLLDLPRRQVNRWVADPRRRVWEDRCRVRFSIGQS